MFISIVSSERGWRVDSGSASPVPGPDEDLAFTRPDPMSSDEWEALLAASLDEVVEN